MSYSAMASSSTHVLHSGMKVKMYAVATPVTIRYPCFIMMGAGPKNKAMTPTTCMQGKLLLVEGIRTVKYCSAEEPSLTTAPLEDTPVSNRLASIYSDLRGEQHPTLVHLQHSLKELNTSFHGIENQGGAQVCKSSSLCSACSLNILLQCGCRICTVLSTDTQLICCSTALASCASHMHRCSPIAQTHRKVVQHEYEGESVQGNLCFD